MEGFESGFTMLETLLPPFQMSQDIPKQLNFYKEIEMTGKKWVILCILLAGVATAAVATVQAKPAQPRMKAQSAQGATFTYQGRLEWKDEPITGSCQMAFRLYNHATSESVVGSAITTTVPISGGLFTTDLDFGANAFDGNARWLGIRVNCPGDAGFTDLDRQALTAVPYALYAARSGGPENVVTVAKSGGDYSEVQTAIDSISDAAADNAYLVWVAPGVYEGHVIMRPYIHLQGAGQEATIITSTISGETTSIQATLALTHHVSLRDLTVSNSGALTTSVALSALDGTTQTRVTDVTARGQGEANDAFGIYLTGSDTAVTLQDVTGVAQNGSRNRGLVNHSEAATTLHGGTFIGRGGNTAYGIQNSSSATIETIDVTALGENSSNLNYGLYVGYGATATLRGGTFTGRGGSSTAGIYNGGFVDAKLEAENVVAVGENGSSYNRGVHNEHQTTLHGGTFIARAGSHAYGIYNNGAGANLKAADIVASAEGGSVHTDGLFVAATAEARVDSSQIINARLDSGTLYLGVSQLAGDIHDDGGAWHCFQVYDGTYNAITCP